MKTNLPKREISASIQYRQDLTIKGSLVRSTINCSCLGKMEIIKPLRNLSDYNMQFSFNTVIVVIIIIIICPTCRPIWTREKAKAVKKTQ